MVPFQRNGAFWPWKPVHWLASTSNDPVSTTILLGRPQTLTTGGCLAGASSAGDSWKVSQAAEIQIARMHLRSEGEILQAQHDDWVECRIVFHPVIEGLLWVIYI
jgi:hypothetical protein